MQSTRTKQRTMSNAQSLLNSLQAIDAARLGIPEIFAEDLLALDTRALNKHLANTGWDTSQSIALVLLVEAYQKAMW